MLLVGAVDIALGWAWHTAYRAKLHWKLRREGALAAAAVVAMIGAVETVRSFHHPVIKPLLPATEAPPAMTAVATPTTTIPERPLEIAPAAEPAAPAAPAAPIATVEAVPSPAAVEPSDPIGDKIMERLGDEIATGSLDDAPAPSVVKPKATKPAAKRKPSQAGG